MNNELDTLRARLRQLELIEAEYQQLRQLLAYAADNQNLDRYAGDIILQSDPSTGNITDVNALGLELLGYTIEQLREMTIADLEVHLPDEPAPQIYVESNTEKQVYDCLYRQHDGHLIAVKVHKRLIPVNQKILVHYSLEDLSLRKKLWHELSRREDMDFQFREKLKVLNEINAELGVIETFDELCRFAIILGLDRLGFERLSIWFMDAESNRMVGTFGTDEKGELRDERGSSWTFENTYLKDFLDGHRDPIVTQDDAPIYNNQSQIIGYGWHISVPLLYKDMFIGYMTADNYVTQQPMKNYQPELLRLYGATIGHLAAHQRDQEATKALSDAVRLKQERVGMLETFIAHVGHDFRTPLTIIGTNTYLMTKVRDDARKAEIAQSIQNQVMYINRVINQTLEVVKLAGGMEFHYRPMELGILIRQSAEVLEPEARKKNLQWEIKTPVPVMVNVDAEWIERAIYEMMENAIQYTPDGGRVSVELSTSEAEVLIRVTDSGVGIPEDDVDKIFNHLYRVDQARTQQGVGLGLTLAKQVIDAHNGQIRVQSAPNQGSTFEISLPR